MLEVAAAVAVFLAILVDVIVVFVVVIMLWLLSFAVVGQVDQQASCFGVFISRHLVPSPSPDARPSQLNAAF